jgi:predicted transcriptional regulator
MSTLKVTGNFIKLPRVLIRDSEVSATELRVWCELASHSDTYIVSAYTIAKNLKLHPTNVNKSLRGLKAKGLAIIIGTGAKKEYHWRATLPDKES